MPFFDIRTPKSGPRLSFLHVRCSLVNLLRATAGCHFWTSELPKVLPEWCVLYILTWTSGTELVCLYILTSKWASRHSGMQFFISHLTRWLRIRCFSEPTLRPSRTYKSLEKRCVSRPDFCFFLLCFSSLHIVGSWTSKLPLMTLDVLFPEDTVSIAFERGRHGEVPKAKISKVHQVFLLTGCINDYLAFFLVL